LDQDDAAISDYTDAIQLDPRPIDYWSRAWLYEQTGDGTRALADFDQAIKLRPDEPMLYLLRAEVYARTSQAQLAATDLNTEAKLADGSLFCLHKHAWVGDLAIRTGQERSGCAARGD
jgi:Tfp pilus assembly protein PilF